MYFIQWLFYLIPLCLPSKVFQLGQGQVTRYTLMEFRHFFSVYFHHIDTQAQDRFHTHAFNSYAWVLSGGYTDVTRDGIKHEYRAGDLRYIPREFNHKLTKALPDTLTLLVTGPYAGIWTEELDNGTLLVLTQHHKILYRAMPLLSPAKPKT